MKARKHADYERLDGMTEKGGKENLAIVFKADTVGTAEAIISGIRSLDLGNVTIEAIYSGTGHISKSDLFMAENGSRLIVGFNVGLLPRIKETAGEKGIEIHLHDIIYRLIDDIKEIAQSMVPAEEKEIITGSARVIAIFRGGHKGIILGCQVLDGKFSVGKKFRLISEPGTVYVGTIDSLHIEAQVVKEAVAGQQVGLKIPGFKRAKEGDLVECFEIPPIKRRRWQPRGELFDLRSGRN